MGKLLLSFQQSRLSSSCERFFWVHAKLPIYQVVSFVRRNNIIINEKSIAKLLNHNGKGKKCYDVVQRWSDLMEVNRTIFKSKRVYKKDGLHDHLRI